MLNDDRVVKLPKRPIYKKIYTEPLNLFKNNPAKAEPLIFTKIVVIGSPVIEILSIDKKYLREEPTTAPDISAKYAFMKMINLFNELNYTCVSEVTKTVTFFYNSCVTAVSVFMLSRNIREKFLACFFIIKKLR